MQCTKAAEQRQAAGQRGVGQLGRDSGSWPPLPHPTQNLPIPLFFGAHSLVPTPPLATPYTHLLPAHPQHSALRAAALTRGRGAAAATSGSGGAWAPLPDLIGSHPIPCGFGLPQPRAQLSYLQVHLAIAGHADGATIRGELAQPLHDGAIWEIPSSTKDFFLVQALDL